MADDELTPRQRRAQQAKKSSKPKASTSWLTPATIGWGLAILIIGGAVAGFMSQQAKEDECPGHWHATYALVIDGERVPYTNYDLGSPLPLSYHMHTPDDQEWHFEPPRIQCVEFATPLAGVHTDLGSDSITLSGDRHAQSGFAGTYETNETHTIQAYHALGWSDDWEPISIGELKERQLKDGERVLVMYGDYTEDEVAEWQGRVDQPSGVGQVNPNHPGA